MGAEETHVPYSSALTTTTKLECSCFTDAKTEAQRDYFAPGSAIGKWWNQDPKLFFPLKLGLL